VNQQRQFWVRGGLVVIAGLLVVGGGWVLVTYPPADYDFYPKCVLHQSTGLHCTGCGLTRSASSLLRGDLSQALAYNQLLVFFLPYLTYYFVRVMWRWYHGIRPMVPYAVAVNPWIMRFFVVVLVGFTILRNVPVEPFTWLAPHELPGR
jgi:Protein of unknown function (DUF2752)